MKLKQILLAVVVVAMTAACNHATDDTTPAPAPKGVSVSLVASADTDDATRTALGTAENGSYKYEWSAGDQIGVSVISEGAEVLNNVTLKSGSSGVSTTFGGTISEAEAAKIPAGQFYDYVGYYPATATYNHSSGQFSFGLPAVHSASSNVFSGACDFMIAKAEGRSTIAVSDGSYPLAMRFQHIFSFFEIPLTSNNMNHKVTKVVIEAAESALAGDVVVGFDGEGKPEIQTVNNGSRTITINVPSGWSTSEKIWVPFIPGAAGEKVTITLTNAIGMSWSFAKTAPAAGFTRANVYRMSGATPSYDVTVSLDNILTLINNDASKTIKDPTALNVNVSVSTLGVDAVDVEDLGVIYSLDGAAEEKVSLANNTLSASQTWTGLASGKYAVKAYATVGGTDFVSESKSVDVFGEVALSVVAPTSYSWYVGDNGQTKNVTTANSKAPLTIYAPTATMTAKDSRYAGYTSLLANCVTAYSIKEGSNNISANLNGVQIIASDMTKSVGSYSITASATFGTYTATATTTSHVTGLPYKATPPKSSDGWSFSRSYYEFTDSYLRLNSGGNALNIEANKSNFYAPANVNVNITSSKIEIENTAIARIKMTISCSGSSVGSLQGSGSWNTNTFTFSGQGTLTTSNPKITIKTENNAAGRVAYIYNLNVEYR